MAARGRAGGRRKRAAEVTWWRSVRRLPVREEVGVGWVPALDWFSPFPSVTTSKPSAHGMGVPGLEVMPPEIQTRLSHPSSR